MRISCPLPQLDFDLITLGHGAGGLLMNQLLDSGVFDLLKNPLLDTRHDGAVFELPGRIAFSTDSYVISPIFFPGGNIGELAVNGTVNDLAMCGAAARYLSLAFILEEGLPMQEFWDVLVSIKFAAERAQALVVTGDTKVVERGKGDKIFINVSGVGAVHPLAQIDLHRIRPGDQIIASGYIATHGIAILSVREGLEFETTLQSDTTNLNHTVLRLLDQFGADIKLLRDPTRGGVASTLNEIARDTRLGVEIRQEAIRVHEEVAGACEMLGLDPLYVANEGVFLMIVSAGRATQILEALQRLPHGANAALIGEVVDNHPQQVILHSRAGGRRVVQMLIGEQLPRIC